MVCYVNDTPQPLANNWLLADLLASLGQTHFRGLAVAVNDQVIPQAAWGSYAVQPHDRVLLIRATQGG
ncbi:sulfur carrier protein ThiS [Hymenobacter sp. RP-2-7]|uniref:Sulfur carrier protein ThiS n=1 Tax=Hymenobacter polaris TaxID=2682546 RepID=A0A7Y0FLI6_9BACT|nr:sulfur carrier protein ThiS [Hymenobacter polaris]NML64441.1 sulfur carrier protein ThiS [Hymenobacter polaris]